MPNNLKWDVRFMRLAREISSWSKDPSSKIGSVIVDSDRRILATGYNGFPRGIADTEERLNNREEKYPRIVHAEMNALMSALYSGVSVRDASIYVWGLPVCSDCAKNILQSGIKKVIIAHPDKIADKWRMHWYELTWPLLKEAKVSISEIDAKYLD